jgi:hypothetical protein
MPAARRIGRAAVGIAAPPPGARWAARAGYGRWYGWLWQAVECVVAKALLAMTILGGAGMR